MVDCVKVCYGTKKSWETTYDNVNPKKGYAYNVAEYSSSLEDEIRPHLSEEEYNYVMSKDNKPNAITDLQSKHIRILTDDKKLWDFSFLNI